MEKYDEMNHLSKSTPGTERSIFKIKLNDYDKSNLNSIDRIKEDKIEFPRFDTYLAGTILKVIYNEEYLNEKTKVVFVKKLEDLVLITEKDIQQDLVAVSINNGDIWSREYDVEILSIEIIREGRVKIIENDN